MIAIIKYNAGNIQSVQNALSRLGYKSVVTDDPKVLLTAEKVIFPGVGEASSAMRYLRDRKLDDTIKNISNPFLGICLGMQLMCEHSEENDTDCLGIFNTKVKKFPPTGIVPHMGWNNFTDVNGALFRNVTTNDDVYYVHGYYVELNEQTIATCTYLKLFAVALQKNNFYATQFHPEKSAGVGEQILKNFLAL